MRFVTFLIVVILCATTYADTWIRHATMQSKEHTFGETKIVVEYGGRQPGYHYEYHAIKIYRDEQLMALYRNVGITDIFASDDNKFFIGVSNRGIPGTAFIIFDKNGNLIKEVKHRFILKTLGFSFYTNQSITTVREWYNKDKPEVRFDIQNKLLKSVKITGSNGLTYNLLEPYLGLDPEQGKISLFKLNLKQYEEHKNREIYLQQKQ